MLIWFSNSVVIQGHYKIELNLIERKLYSETSHSDKDFHFHNYYKLIHLNLRL